MGWAFQAVSFHILASVAAAPLPRYPVASQSSDPRREHR